MAKKETVLSKLNGHCAYCGKKLKLAKATCDHIVARSKGGGNGVENLHPACRLCNSMKGAESVESFRLKFFGTPSNPLNWPLTTKWSRPCQRRNSILRK